VLFTVKSFGLDEAAKSLPPLLKSGTAVIALQNGVDAEERLGRLIGNEYVMGGVAEISAAIAEPGVIRQVSEYKRIRFGEMDGGLSARGQAILAAFQEAGLDATFTPDIQKALWTKFVMLVTTSGLTSAARTNFGALRGDPDIRPLMVAAVAEAVAVGRAKGVDLGPDAAERAVAWIDTLPAQGRASMAVDLERGNRLELPWLSGTVVRLGKELGVPTPTHAFIHAVLKLHQDGRRG
jgi:2-dehydropantoate 2-reductase